VPETLLESELFGFTRGAFTGAVASKLGLFAEADGGTLFLDEIGEMPGALQVKLLRTLQSGEIRRLGATQATTIDVRVIAATNRDLAAMISGRSFREDLFYRLNVIEVVLPPLRERREDLPALAEYFASRSAARLGREIRLAPETVDRLLRYPWPGNVRELENAIERAVILARGEAVTPEDLPPHVAAGLNLGPSPALPKQTSLAEAERSHILTTLERYGRNHSAAAEALGIGRTTLWRKLKEYGIEQR
jgi:transcriptional regulator with PAS, ATPase and Fis domain